MYTFLGTNTLHNDSVYKQMHQCIDEYHCSRLHLAKCSQELTNMYN